MTCRLRIHLFCPVPDCWCLFTGIVMIICVQPQTWGVSTGCGCVTFLLLLLSNWDGASLGVGALRKPHTLHISIVHVAHTGPQGHFSVGPLRGRGLNPPPPTPVHATEFWIAFSLLNLQFENFFKLSLNITLRTFFCCFIYTGNANVLFLQDQIFTVRVWLCWAEN